MNILKNIYYFIFEVKVNKVPKISYIGEKLYKIPYILLRILGFNITLPYIIKNDYILENSCGIWYIKAKTDYDFTINPFTEKELEEYFEIKNGIFLDIGAHIGKWSIFLGKKNIKTYAFEPNIETFSDLSKNIQLNGLENIIIPINYGISNKNGILKFLQDKDNTSISKFSEDGNIEVTVITIDNFIIDNNINIDDIKLIKIDTEGFEYNVLQGMYNLLYNSKEVKVICEILETQKDKNNILNFFDSLELKSYRIGNTNNYIFYKK